MAPLRSYSNWNQRPSDNKDQIEPYRKYFIIAEGMNTERWYFEELINLRKEFGIHPLIDVRYIERTGEDEGSSHPAKLLCLADKCRASSEFDSSHDRMIVVFDADIFECKGARATGLSEIIAEGSKSNILGITNPSFELFLLLHFPGAYEKAISKNTQAIVDNEKIGSQRYISVLLRSFTGINAKRNESIKSLVKKLFEAIEQEKKVNQDILSLHGKVTSNIGKILESIVIDNPSP